MNKTKDDKLEGSSDRFSLPAVDWKCQSRLYPLLLFPRSEEYARLQDDSFVSLLLRNHVYEVARWTTVSDVVGCYPPFDLRFGNDRPGQREFRCR